MDRDPSRDTSVTRKAVRIGEHFEAGAGVAAQLPGSWPRFRGTDFDNVCKANVKLADRWPEGGPRLIWQIDAGEGHAAPVVADGRVYFLDYDEEREADALRCLSLDDGREIWRRWYEVRVKRNHGMSRTVPALGGGYLVTIGPKCHVMCVDAVSGDLKWGLDLVSDFGTKEPLWYTGQCPLIEEGEAVIAPAGTNTLVMGVDCATGEAVWSVPNRQKWLMSHSSLMPMTFDGKRMYV